jgi:hypothetical protein
MKRYFDGDQILADVSRALEDTLSRHGVELYSLLGVTTILEAISSPLKFHNLQGKAGQKMGQLGQQAYSASTLPRRIALLQSPHDQSVNQMMESIVVALQRAGTPLDEATLRRNAYRVFLGKPRATIAAVEKESSSLSPAFSFARNYLTEGKIISQTGTGLWRLHELWETL